MNQQKNTINRYQILKIIGKGGMGEVFLAYDPICQRNITIKKIRSDLSSNAMIRKRFIKEAIIASQLNHPSIVPIYSIHSEKDYLYYTMPYVEGKTLKEILNDSIKNKDDEYSIPNLIQIFLKICEAVAYTHNKNILHRDLKPNNIIIGKYGEVLILDWGIACYKDEELKKIKNEKIIGTLSFIAPEKILGEPSSVLTDIYSLGIILYKILTLSFPFIRPSISYFKKFAKKEKLIDPIEKAPYRNVPHHLSEIAKKCLFFEKSKRYQNVEEIISDIKNYIEGKPKWILKDTLDIKNKKYWLFNENIFVPKYTAITQNSEFAHWATVMLAKISISGNIKIESQVLLKKNSSKIGFLLSLPNTNDKFSIEDGYCLWIEKNHIKLIRSNTLVRKEKIKDLELNSYYFIKIEKKENVFSFYLNKKKIISYVSHIPIVGTHLGIIYKDLDFSIKNIKIFSSSNGAIINCLAIPDAFLSKKDFNNAYNEYKNIAFSFPGRTEGINALFGAGIVLLEKAKIKKDKNIFQKALDEFENLKKTPGAPLEYLGKSLVYASLREYEEEAKCLELVIRKFKNHPLYSTLKEHMIYRIHESTLQNREIAYRLILLSILHIPSIKNHWDTKTLIDNLSIHIEKLYFIIPSNYSLEIDLAFRLNKPKTLLEIFNKTEEDPAIKNICFSLLELKADKELKFCLNKKPNKIISFLLEEPIIKYQKILFENLNKNISLNDAIVLIFLIKKALDKNETKTLKEIFIKLKNFKYPKEYKEIFDYLYIWFLLLNKEYKKTKLLFNEFNKEKLKDENSYIFFLYGIYLYAIKSKQAKNHFSQFLETRYPKTPSLFSYFITNKIDKWLKRAFRFEKKELYRQLVLYYHIVEDKEKYLYFLSKLNNL